MSSSRRVQALILATAVALTGWGVAAPPTSAATTVPVAPTNVTLSTGVIVRWVDNADNETSYVIERSFGSQGFGVVGTVGANVTSFTDVGVGIATYTYRVRARNDQGSSASATSAPITLISSNSSIPVSMSASPTSGTVPLSVTFTTTSTAPTITWYFGDGTTANGPSVTHTYSDFLTYAATLVVRAPGVEGFGQDVGTAVTLISALAPPLTAPNNLAAVSTTRGTVRLTWTNPISDATEMLVVRCVTRKCSSPTVVGTLAPRATSFLDATVKSGTTYDYWLVVRNAVGETARSNSVTIKAR
jgi:PKD repeat protein